MKYLNQIIFITGILVQSKPAPVHQTEYQALV